MYVSAMLNVEYNGPLTFIAFPIKYYVDQFAIIYSVVVPMIYVLRECRVLDELFDAFFAGACACNETILRQYLCHMDHIWHTYPSSLTRDRYSSSRSPDSVGSNLKFYEKFRYTFVLLTLCSIAHPFRIHTPVRSSVCAKAFRGDYAYCISSISYST